MNNHKRTGEKELEQNAWGLVSNILRSEEQEAIRDQVRTAFKHPHPEASTHYLVAYIRANTEAAADDQQSRLETYATLKGWKIVEVFVATNDDPAVAAISKRPILRELKEAVDTNVDIIGVLVTDYSVLASDADVCLDIIGQLPVDVVPLIEDAVYESI